MSTPALNAANAAIAAHRFGLGEADLERSVRGDPRAWLLAHGDAPLPAGLAAVGLEPRLRRYTTLDAPGRYPLARRRSIATGACTPSDQPLAAPHRSLF